MKLYTEPELAEMLGVETATLQKYRKQGKIKGAKISQRKIVYLEEDVLEFLNMMKEVA
jgi:predicted site-specific integrase-resolvase